ncbi:MAG: hypothetical protein JO019_01595 [Candidatus Kaiserbacteria bacterium]|nr:hypothetical protein [Candidatus Kaiserbacteria bacterium]
MRHAVTLLAVALLSRVREKGKTSRPPWHPLVGWRWLFGVREIPSISTDFADMLRLHPELTEADLVCAASSIEEFRTPTEIPITGYDTLCGLIFELGRGSLLVVVPAHASLRSCRVRTYVMGESSATERSNLGGKLVHVLEEYLFGPAPDFEMPLRKK